jgi:nitrate/nitrite-specific signal transduction histidine kinase
MIDKKAIKKQYKQSLTPMGIYQVTNTVNGKIFIGKAMNLPGKLNSVSFQLAQGAHMCRELQADYVRMGKDKITVAVLDYLEPKNDPTYDYANDLQTLEEIWLEKLQPYGDKGYNTRRRKTVSP